MNLHEHVYNKKSDESFFETIWNGIIFVTDLVYQGQK